MKLNVLCIGLALLALVDAASRNVRKDDTGASLRVRRVQELEEQELEAAKVALEEAKAVVAELEAAIKPVDLALEAQQDALTDTQRSYNETIEACTLLMAEHDDKIAELEAFFQTFNNNTSAEDGPLALLQAEYDEANALVAATTGAEKTAAKAKRTEVKARLDAAKAAKSTAREAAKDARNAAKAAKNGDKTACGVSRDAAKQARNDAKAAFNAAKNAAKAAHRELKQAIKAMLRAEKTVAGKENKLVKKLDKIATKAARDAAKKQGAGKESVEADLVPGHCVADHICAAWRGDPHMYSFDGKRFDCGGEGEFVLAKAIGSDSSFEVQGRFESIGKSSMVSITTAVSITTGYEGEPDVDIFTEDRGDGCELFFYVNGVAEDFSEPVDGISFEQTGSNAYVFFTNSGILYTAFGKNGNFGCVLGNKLCLPPSMVEDPDMTIVGLLGTPDGDDTNEWTDDLGSKLSQADMSKPAGYSYCTTNWCVRDPADSIFAYLVGDDGVQTDHSTYFNCDAPFADGMEALEITPPAECEECCADVADEILKTECLEECAMADPGQRMAQCLIDQADAEELADIEKKCKDPEIPDDVGFSPPSETNEPTAAPITVAGNCPDGTPDVVIGHTEGLTVLPDLPIEIVERKTGSVKFQVSNVFATALEKVFIQFDDLEDNTECIKKEPFKTTDTVVYEALCMESAPITVVNIWISDPLAVDGTAEIPQCCHGTPGDENPKVHFSFHIRCECPTTL